jgi:hypothetical protein
VRLGLGACTWCMRMHELQDTQTHRILQTCVCPCACPCLCCCRRSVTPWWTDCWPPLQLCMRVRHATGRLRHQTARWAGKAWTQPGKHASTVRTDASTAEDTCQCNHGPVPNKCHLLFPAGVSCTAPRMNAITTAAPLMVVCAVHACRCKPC